MCKAFGWSYDYLLWGINWLSVRLMVADAARWESFNEDGTDDPEKTVHRELKNKDDIKNYVKGLM